MISRILQSDFPQRLAGTEFRMVIGLGFDLRCTFALEAALLARPAEVIALVNVGWATENIGSVQRFTRLVPSCGRLVGSEAKNILELADTLAANVEAFDEKLSVIDVTSMSHELLCILVAILNVKGKLRNTLFCYNGADRYSVNTADDAVWLSRGVSSIRSVLGYPGVQVPSKPLHLTITVGFEVERAKEVIAQYEPHAVSLGVGERDQSVSHEHYLKNRRFFDQLNDFLAFQSGSLERVNHFEFSCIDPLATKATLASHLEKYPDHNNVVCPLNTKLSTLGAALLCLEQPATQLCYAQPIEYNVVGYATPSTSLTLFQFDP